MYKTFIVAAAATLALTGAAYAQQATTGNNQSNPRESQQSGPVGTTNPGGTSGSMGAGSRSSNSGSMNSGAATGGSNSGMSSGGASAPSAAAGDSGMRSDRAARADRN